MKKLYGYQKELFVIPIENFIGCTKNYPESVAGLEIFCQNITFHSKASKRVIKNFKL